LDSHLDSNLANSTSMRSSKSSESVGAKLPPLKFY